MRNIIRYRISALTQHSLVDAKKVDCSPVKLSILIFSFMMTTLLFTLVSISKAEAAEAKKGSPKSNAAQSGSLKGIAGGSKGKSDAPLYVKSDSLSLDSKGRVFTYTGNVEVVRDDVTITAEVVEGHYGEDNQIKTIIARRDVVITRGDDLRATSNRAIYRVADAKIELTEGPELYRNGSALAADKVTIFVNEDRSEAEGNVRVKVINTQEVN